MDLRTYLAEQPRGSARKLANDLSVSPSYLSQLASGKTRRSPERCVQIERATGGQVTRRELRPDDWQQIWPELSAEA